MSKRFFAVAFAIGLVAVAWVAAGFVGSSWLALAMTLVIAGVYLLGAAELRQFRAATQALATALADKPEPITHLGDWLASVPPALRNAVRLRIEGERGGLPGPALTPYLVGLLVMLGMLGTFLGMVITFKGAVFTLEGSADLQAIRAALAAPIKGLALSFGTSVAGVAASAMLGLMSAISRRERIDVARLLDGRLATSLLPFSLNHQRQETFRAVQVQARVLPEVVDRLDALMAGIERRSQQLDAQLLQRQAQFQREATAAYTELAQAVGAALQDSLAAGARAAGESIRPAIESTMTQLLKQAQQLHERLGERNAALLTAIEGGLAQSQSEAAQREAQRLEAWTQALHATAAQLRTQWQQAGEEAAAQQQAVCQVLENTAGQIAERTSAQASRTLDDVARLLAQSQELVRARHDAEARWTEELGQRMGLQAERDNLALRERSALLEQLGALLQAVTQASGEQRAAIEALVASAASVMDQASQRFAASLDAHAGKAADMAVQVTGSAIELASLGEAFGQGVQLFQASNDKLMETLQRIEATMQRGTARSDEQLAYYVAQAREVIDLSIASQQGLVENLRQLRAQPRALADEVPG